MAGNETVMVGDSREDGRASLLGAAACPALTAGPPPGRSLAPVRSHEVRERWTMVLLAETPSVLVRGLRATTCQTSSC